MSVATLDKVETMVSLKQIVAAIDDVLQRLEAGGTPSERVERTREALTGVKETVKAQCVPDFSIPLT